jgi:hypothetical protein
MITIKFNCDKCKQELRFHERQIIIKEPSEAFNKNGLGEPDIITTLHFCNDCFDEIKKLIINDEDEK